MSSPRTDDLGPVLAHLARTGGRILEDLIEFASIPGVSADPAHASDVMAASRWVTNALRSAGPITVRTIITPGHPVIYGEWVGAPGKPTVLVYGHYDVQPPPSTWERPPFTPIVRNGELHAHGVADDKGPTLIPIKVAESYLAVRGALPLNVKFLIEGEQDVGSPSFEALVRQHCEMLGADVVLSANGEKVSDDGSRGDIDAEAFALRVADAALHANHCEHPLVIRVGGSVPAARVFRRHMGLDTVFFSFTAGAEDSHAPTESFPVNRLHDGLDAWARFWEILGTMHS